MIDCISSVRKVEEIVSSVVVQSHSIAADYHKCKVTYEVKESREPHDPKPIPVDASHQVSIHEELLHASVEIVKVEALVGG
jgi:hypothetical protein